VVTTIAGATYQKGTILGSLPGGFDSLGAIAVIDQNTLAILSGTAVLKLTLTQ
jgi:hypothetical protein